MDILNYGAQLLRDQLGGDLDIGAVAEEHGAHESVVAVDRVSPWRDG